MKIQNGDYDLGAQRREHDKNNLPLVLEIIKKYKEVLFDCHSALDAESIKKKWIPAFAGMTKKAGMTKMIFTQIEGGNMQVQITMGY